MQGFRSATCDDTFHLQHARLDEKLTLHLTLPVSACQFGCISNSEYGIRNANTVGAVTCTWACPTHSAAHHNFSRLNITSGIDLMINIM